MTGLVSSQMKLVLERHLSICVTKCIWSPKMDLLLTANSYGQVSLQRHRSLQRVWQLAAPVEHNVVTGLAWRPDSNLIAIGYQSGLVMLVTLETGTMVHKFEVPNGVTSLAWQQHCSPAATGQKDVWSDYMTPLPASDKWFTESSNNDNSNDDQQTWQNSHILDNQDTLTLLVVGSGGGQVLLYAFGLVHCATINLRESVAGADRVVDAQCSHNMNMLSVLVESKNELACTQDGEPMVDVAHVLCDMTVVAEHHKELYLLARKYSEIQSLFNYSTDAISQLREAWEGILLEMDTKLDAYSGLKEEEEVSADFLDLLVLGHTSQEFYMFLRNKLTEKGLKKLRETVELSYTNMHKLVVKQLEAVGQGLVFVISQVLGMARTSDKFGLLGVEEEVVTVSMKEAGAFLFKTAELQEVIGQSMRDFLAFLKWLSAVHLRMSGSTVPQELAKTTMQETSYIVSFLHDTLEEVVTDKDGNRHRKFRLEGVGQYLQDEFLKSPQETANNPWLKFLELNPELQNHPMIVPQRRNTSLIQEYSTLAKEVSRLAERSVEVIGQKIGVSKGVSLFQIPENTEMSVSQRSNPSGKKMNAIIVPGSNSPVFYFCQWNTDINKVYKQVLSSQGNPTIPIAAFTFTPTNCLSSSMLASPDKSLPTEDQSEEAPIIAAQFYNEDIASVLVQDFSNVMRTLFIQVPVSVMEESMVTVRVDEGNSVTDSSEAAAVDLSKAVTASSVRRLDVSAGLFGVSGERRVAVVVAKHRRTMVLYEMEVDEEDEEEEEDDEEEPEEADKGNM